MTDNPIAKIVKAMFLNVSRPERVGPRVTAMRETLALNKSEFADSIALDRSTLTKVEKGEMGLDVKHAVAFAELYGFGLNYIYRGDVSDVPDRLRPTLLLRMLDAGATR
jgi:DNA-binding XRE family transcriptional regulator